MKYSMIPTRFLVLMAAALLMQMCSAFQSMLPGAHSASRVTALFEKKSGTVKWFNTMKGFGFIMPVDDSGDVFVHQTAIQTEGFRSLADGEEVEYEEELDGNGRKRAVKVTGPGGQAVQGAPFRPQNDYDQY